MKKVTRADIEAKVLEVVLQIEKYNEVPPRTINLDTKLELDSIDLLDIAMELEKEFDIDFGFNIPHWSTVLEIVNDIEKRIAQRIGL